MVGVQVGGRQGGGMQAAPIVDDVDDEIDVLRAVLIWVVRQLLAVRIFDLVQLLAIQLVDVSGELAGIFRVDWVVVGVVEALQVADLVRVVEGGGILGGAKGAQRRFVVVVVLGGALEPLVAVLLDGLPQVHDPVYIAVVQPEDWVEGGDGHRIHVAGTAWSEGVGAADPVLGRPGESLLAGGEERGEGGLRGGCCGWPLGTGIPSGCPSGLGT